MKRHPAETFEAVEKLKSYGPERVSHVLRAPSPPFLLAKAFATTDAMQLYAIRADEIRDPRMFAMHFGN
jgi:hypothetical protein